MPSGNLCPQCGEPVMSYGRFLREADPHKVSRCSNCDTELRRKKSVWLLFTLGGLIDAAVTLLAALFVYERWGLVPTVVTVLVLFAVSVWAMNFCGWLFVGWELAAPDQSSADSPG